MPLVAPKLYVGVDPSLRSSGVALVTGDACRVYAIQPPKKMPEIDCLKYHRDAFSEFLPEAVERACVEAPSHGSQHRADTLGQIRGVYLLVLKDHNIPVLMASPKSVKKFATGNGGADKDKMVLCAQLRWPGVLFINDDVADAAWMAALAQAWDLNPALLKRYQLEAINGMRKSSTKIPRPRYRDTGINV